MGSGVGGDATPNGTAFGERGAHDGKVWGENDGHADGDGRGDVAGLEAEMVNVDCIDGPRAW